MAKVKWHLSRLLLDLSFGPGASFSALCAYTQLPAWEG